LISQAIEILINFDIIPGAKIFLSVFFPETCTMWNREGSFESVCWI